MTDEKYRAEWENYAALMGLAGTEGHMEAMLNLAYDADDVKLVKLVIDVHQTLIQVARGKIAGDLVNILKAQTVLLTCLLDRFCHEEFEDVQANWREFDL